MFGIKLTRASAIAVVAVAGCMGPPPRYEAEVGRGTHLWPLAEVSYEPDGRETDILWLLLAFDNKETYKFYALRPLFMITTDPDAGPVRK